MRTYGYDAFGNRTHMTEGDRETTYTYNAMNQLMSRMDSMIEETYAYDRRGNLSLIMENGSLKNSYTYEALNRLEQAVNGNGEAAVYEYNGLGHRVGVDSETKIRYTIDLTRGYHNLLAGAIAGTGVGIVGLAVGGAAVGAGNYVAKTTVNKEWKEKSVEQHLIEGSLNVVEWSLATILGGSMKESRGIINGIREEYKFASSMLGAEATRGIPAKIFYETVKKDIVNAFGKAVWETFYKSFFRTGIVGGGDTLYNTFFKDKVVEYFSEGCIKDD